MKKDTARYATTPEGVKVAWDICGNPICQRHVNVTPETGCPTHPVEPAYLRRALGQKVER